MSNENIENIKDKLVYAGKFALGVPMGIVVGVIPLLGLGIGTLYLGGKAGDPRSKAECQADKSESFDNGITTGLVIGMVGQIALSIALERGLR